jgi:voltage-gated potassium channel Kch
VDVEHVVEQVSDRYGVVILLILATYVLASALPDGAWSQVVLAVMAAVTVMATLAASGTPSHRRRVALLLATIAVIISTITALVGGHTTGIAGLISGALLTASLVAIIGRIARHQSVSAQTLLGAMCCYVLFGLVYTFFFEAIARLQSTPFLSPPGNHSLSDYLFFSFSTLTTTGYGDLVPATGLGRALAMLEALMGQLFLVTVLARLVALWVPARRARDRESAASSPSLGED